MSYRSISEAARKNGVKTEDLEFVIQFVAGAVCNQTWPPKKNICEGCVADAVAIIEYFDEKKRR